MDLIDTQTGPLLALIDLESSLSNFPQVESLFATTLKSAAGDAVVAPSVGIWKAYLHYVRRQNQLVEGPNLEKTRQTITQGYEFALGQCGVDMDAGEIWAEYLAFVQGSNVC
jgi:cleavage stimulation factor subunit 3